MTFEAGQRVRAEGTRGDRRGFEGREGVVTEVKDTLFGRPMNSPWVCVLFDGASAPHYLYASEVVAAPRCPDCHSSNLEWRKDWERYVCECGGVHRPDRLQ